MSLVWRKSLSVLLAQVQLQPHPSYWQLLLYGGIFVFKFGGLGLSVGAQEIPSIVPPPQDSLPLDSGEEPLPGKPLPDSPSEPLQKPEPADLQAVPAELSQTEFEVTEFQFQGGDEQLPTLFSEMRLQEEARRAIQNYQQSSANEVSQKLDLSALLKVAEAIANLYRQEGYSTSGAVIRIPEQTRIQRTGPVIVEVIEGQLDQINLQVPPETPSYLRANYVKSRLGVEEDQLLNVEHLRERLQLLQLDPLIQGVRAELNAGVSPGSSLLNLEYVEASPKSLTFTGNNGRSPSVGSFQRGANYVDRNLLGFGDRFTFGYNNSSGSNSIDTSYTIPLNPLDGTFGVSFSRGWNDVIESPFDDINDDGDTPDIESESQTYELTLRQPISRRIQNRVFRETAIGLTGSLRHSNSFFLDEGLPLSPGAEADGTTRIATLRFFQEWTQQDAKQVIALRSQFNFGLDALGSTINESVPGAEAIPDSRFFSWRGQAQWVRLLAPETLLTLRGNLQLSNQVLLSSEQFGIGGLGSVRGYRQDQLLTDNGFLTSAELQIPVARIRNWDTTLKLAPFVDFGRGWENSDEEPDPNTLASLGLGFQVAQGDRLTARLDWGIPLISVESERRTWQENGLYFSINYKAQ